MYRYDIHVHTLETSPCGKVKGAEVAKLYKQMGYDGIVITDHYSDRFFLSVRGKTWEKKTERFLAGYREAFRVGSSIGLNVLLGMEINFRWSLNDYLVFGIDEKFLFENPLLHKKNLKEFRRIADKYGYLIYQAHPFRLGMTRADPKLLDGIEVYNGNPRHNSKNDSAAKFALDNGLKMIAGSDFHRLEDAGRGGLILAENPENNEKLVEILRENKIASLITTD
jgi:predicted metal-dependent phosphoesterase TrpH